MKAYTEFIPGSLEKVLDTARNVDTFGNLLFTANRSIYLRLVNPAKTLCMDICLTPSLYRCDEDFSFGVHLPTFYKLIKALDKNATMSWELEEDRMTVRQGTTHFTILSQGQLPVLPAISFEIEKPISFVVNTKTFQRYVKAVGTISPTLRLKCKGDLLQFEADTSLYQTHMDMPLTHGLIADHEEPYEKVFMVKFVEALLNPGIADTMTITLGPTEIALVYNSSEGPMVAGMVMAYTEG